MYADFGPNVALIATLGLHQSLLRSEADGEGNGNLVSRVISHTCIRIYLGSIITLQPEYIYNSYIFKQMKLFLDQSIFAAIVI